MIIKKRARVVAQLLFVKSLEYFGTQLFEHKFNCNSFFQLFARRLDPATGTLSSKLERLTVEPVSPIAYIYGPIVL